MKRTLDEWLNIINECKKSNKSVQEWCLKNNISRHAYYYWHGKLRKKGMLSVNKTVKKQDKESISFIEIPKIPLKQKDVTKVTDVNEMEIEYHEFKIKIKQQYNTSQLENILSILQKIC